MKTVKLLILALVMAAAVSGGPVAQAAPGALAAGFTADVNTGAAPLTIHFYDASEGNPTGWSWDFGDGSSSTLQDPVYTYNTPGTYTVTLTVTDGASTDSMSADVVVNNPLVITPMPPRTPVIVQPILVPIKSPHYVRPIRDHQPPHNAHPNKDKPGHEKPTNGSPGTKHGDKPGHA